MGWIEINICVQRAMLLKVTKYSSPIRIASTITKQIPQRVDIRYFSYSSLANVSFYLSTASFLTSRSSIIIIQRHFYPDLARVLNARWGRSERKCLRKSVNLNPFKLKTWGKKKKSHRMDSTIIGFHRWETLLETVSRSCKYFCTSLRAYSREFGFFRRISHRDGNFGRNRNRLKWSI